MLNHSREINFDDGVTGVTLEDNRELLSAKRKNERLSAYRFLIKNLSEDHQKEFLENSSETLFEAIINSCKKGDSEEKSLALTLASVLFVSIAPDRVEEFFQSTDNLFKDILKTSKDNLKSLCASAIAISSALSDSNTSENLQKVSSLLFENLKVLSGQLDSKDHQPLVLMVKSWAFLITLIKPKIVEEKCFAENVAFLITLLEDNNVQVRLTVAQTLVMLFEIVKQNTNEEDGEFDLDDYQNIFDLDELLETLREKNSKTEISVRRKFEKIVQVLESNLEDEISEDLSGNFSQIKISSWTQSTQLEYFIEIIGKGLVTHFGRNVVFKSFFSNQKNIESLNQKELKKSSKIREQERKKNRDNKNQFY